MEKGAAKMKGKAARLDGGLELPAGSIVRLVLADVDRARLDNNTSTCVVVAKEGKSYRIANNAGVYKELVSRAHLQYVPNVTTILMGLSGVLDNWKELPSISIRRLAAAQSLAGGQGMLHCSCKGKCDTFRCSCLKVGRICTSRCHHHNAKCQNHD